MEHHAIDLDERTWLEVAYEVDAGVEGSYNEAPSNPFISIHSIDDTLFPIDMGMIEFDIEEKLRR